MSDTLHRIAKAFGGGWNCPCGRFSLGDTCACGRPKSRPRALVSLHHECNRGCEGCADTLERTQDERTSLFYMEDLAGFEEIIVTGGEPLLRPVEVQNWLDDYNMLAQRKHQRVYLFTSTSRPHLYDLVHFRWIDGLTFTVHKNPSGEDIEAFRQVQGIAGDSSHLNSRLKLDMRCNVYLDICTSSWTIIEPFTWMGLEESCLPHDAVLFDWQGPLDGSVR